MRQAALLILAFSGLAGQFAPTTGEITVLGIRVSFSEDTQESTTGDGRFLQAITGERCGEYLLDPPPHNRTYFQAQLKAVDSYLGSVSRGRLGIDLDSSRIYPKEENRDYSLGSPMSYFHPYGDEELQDRRLAELYHTALEIAYETDSLEFELFDVIAVFHAGIGQDFSLPFLDPTPEDIPSAYVDVAFLQEQLDDVRFPFPGMVLPETQNHLLYDVADDIFAGVEEPCDYQFGLTGTFALMMGFAIGLPPLWETESGEPGVGVFALMDQGSNNGRGIIPAPPDPWTRMYAGWESAIPLSPPVRAVISARDSVPDAIVKIPINPTEYFLIENRNNWIAPGVDIDSLRWQNRDESGLAGYIETMLDAVDLVRDPETGVITSVPNYDIGLPGSGLLFWHIDETAIREGLHTYSVNGDRERRGIDLEEADGAQDIGYPAPFLFVDPSSGLWSDMWFAGNEQYYVANPGLRGQPISFGPHTFPDTRSNSGADTYLEIVDISEPGRTMSFTLRNDFMAPGFPDTTLHIRFLYDFDRDGANEIVGGRDSLWWSIADSVTKQIFFVPETDSFQLAVTAYESEKPRLVVVTDVGRNSFQLSTFGFDPDLPGLTGEWSLTIHPPAWDWLPYVTSGFPNSVKVDMNWGDTEVFVTEEGIESIKYVDALFDPTRHLTAEITDPRSGETGTLWVALSEGGGLWVEGTGAGLESLVFETVSAVDVDLDGEVEIALTDTAGSLYVVNSNLTFESGFPVPVEAVPPILAGNLFGDDHPELVLQTRSGDLVIVSWEGGRRYRLSNAGGGELRMVGEYRGRSSVVTGSSVWGFDSTASTAGNEWLTIHHDPANTRMLKARVPGRLPETTRLIDGNRTYAYPNPAAGGTTTIRVFVESADRVDIEIYDLAGYFVEKLTLESPLQGTVNEVVWNVSGVESGVYMANVTAGQQDRMESKILKIAVVH